MFEVVVTVFSSDGVMDLKNAYDWLWAHSWEKPGEGWEPETRSSVSPGTPGGFFLKFDERKDQWTFTPGEDGRSRILLQRGGEQWRVD